MKILLTGASGFVGRNLTRSLVAAGHEINGISRSSGANFSELLQAKDWLPYLEGVDAVINAVGIIGQTHSQRFDTVHSQAPKALFEACVQMGIKRVVQISALGAGERAAVAYHLSKRAADDYLRSLDLDWWVLRPSLVYGKGGASSGVFMQVARLPLIPLVGDGQQLVQPVHISDLVAAVQACLAAQPARRTLDVVGPEEFTFAQWLQQMRSAQGLGRGHFVRVPFWLALLGCQLGRWISPLLQPDNLRMLQAGNVANAGPLSQLLGRKPLQVTPELFTSDGSFL